MMKSVNLTEDALQAMRPARGSMAGKEAQQMFEAGSTEADRAPSNAAPPQVASAKTSFDVQKDIIHYTEIHEQLLYYLAQQFIPKFKVEKVEQYRLIMREFARQEILNTQRAKTMWSNVLDHHKKAQMPLMERVAQAQQEQQAAAE